METVDVLIVGAGPSGLICAQKIHEMGFSVIIVDKKNTIGNRLSCGGGVPREIFKTLNIQKKKNFIKEKVIGTKIFFNNEEYTLSDNNWGGFTLDRQLFEKYLEKTSLDKGVDIRTSTELIQSIKTKNLFISKFSNGQKVISKIVIGSDGYPSTVGKEFDLTFDKNKQNFGVAVNYILSDLDISTRKYWHFVFDENILNGYSWIFPWSDTKANVGLSSIPRHTSFESLNYSLVTNVNMLDLLGKTKSQIINRGGGIFPLRTPNTDSNIITDGTFLIGDAGGFIEPIFAEGIYPGMLSGVAASKYVSTFLTVDLNSQARQELFITLWNSMPYSSRQTLGEFLDMMTILKNTLYHTFSSNCTEIDRMSIIKEISI
ncbi:NAD(P)/FAD-dependent oxidoreductase [Candidatus Altiarchaeota archaeon]